MFKVFKGFSVACLLGVAYSQAQVNITMNRYDINRTAANTKESILTASNVNPSTFGKLWSYPVNGVIFAQPLYVQGLGIGSKGNVLFVATMNNLVYAFDADQSGPPLWTRNFGPSVSTSTWTGEIGTHIGVMSTPVIDTPSSSGAIYIVAETLENNNWIYRVHKMSLLTGKDIVPHTIISATKSGITFDPVNENQRPGLTLVNGQVVVSFSARPHDDRPFHGWVMTYDTGSLAQTGAFVTTTSDDGAGVWGSGGAPPVDSAGNFYQLTGNAFNSTTGYNGGAGNFSESLLKFSNPGGALSLNDWFTAFNWSSLDNLDEDLSCNSPMLVPGATAGSQLLIFGSKTADIYVVDIAKPLGHLQNNNSQLKAFFHVGANNPVKFSDGDRILGLAYWQGPLGKTVYAWPAFDSLHNYTYSFNGTSWSFTLRKSNPIKGFGEPGVPISLSANGSQSGTGVVWATMYSSSGRSVGQAGAMHAFNAEDLTEIWNSRMNQTRDDIGSPSKFVIPIVANGRVYAAAATVASSSTTTGVVQVYGLLPVNGGATAAPTFSPAGGTFSGSVSVTLSDSTAGATIRFTTDGSTPTTSSPVYSSPIAVSNTTTIKTFATSTGRTASGVVSATYTIQSGGTTAINFGGGFTSSGLTFNGDASLVGSRLQLTNGLSNVAGSAFFNTPVNIQHFTTQFTFQDTNINGDGMTFTVQGSGPTALGSSGGGLGFQNIPKSVGVKIDLYNNAGEGTSSTGVYLNGATPTLPSTDLVSQGIRLHSGDPFNVKLVYDGTNLTFTITDLTTAVTFTKAFPVNIPATVGSTTAYAGFTGGSGGATAVQQVTQWTFSTP